MRCYCCNAENTKLYRDEWLCDTCISSIKRSVKELKITRIVQEKVNVRTNKDTSKMS